MSSRKITLDVICGGVTPFRIHSVILGKIREDTEFGATVRPAAGVSFMPALNARVETDFVAMA